MSDAPNANFDASAATATDAAAVAANEVSVAAPADPEVEALLKRSREFGVNGQSFHPLTTNRLETLKAQGITNDAEIKDALDSVVAVVHQRVWEALPGFIEHFQKHTTYPLMNGIYKDMTREKAIERFLTKRPLVFYTGSDAYKLRDGQTGWGWINVGYDHCTHCPVDEYMPYEEMKMSSLVALGSFSRFINDGNRQNKGVPGREGEFIPSGIIIGAVGARFESPNKMEWEECIVGEIRNAKWGYGKEDTNEKLRPWRQLWAKLYGEDYLPSYEEAYNDTTGRFYLVRPCTYLDMKVYTTRMRMQAEVLLLEANLRGQNAGKKVYLHTVGIGLGVWQVSDKQTDCFARAWQEAMEMHDLSSIADVDFSWVRNIEQHMAPNGEPYVPSKNPNIKVHVSQRAPHAPIEGQEDKLLVEIYAWDGNSFPGNEYWNNELSASGDPAAAAASTIAELHNPVINPNVGKKIRVWPAAADVAPVAAAADAADSSVPPQPDMDVDVEGSA